MKLVTPLCPDYERIKIQDVYTNKINKLNEDLGLIGKKVNQNN